MRRKLFFLPVILILASCHDRSFENSHASPEADSYKLEQVLVMSRHNLRAPFTGKGSVTDSLTPHKDMWHEWSARTGELTRKGGIAETLLGQYFREWLESEGLIPGNWQPSRREVYFYANSLQRTVATARHFASGLSPVAGIDIKYLPDRDDGTFLGILSADSDAFREEAARERDAILTEAFLDSIAKAAAVMEQVLDFENSDFFRVHGKHFAGDEITITDYPGSEPRMRGMLRTALSASDALVMQSYEDGDLQRAAFGHDIGEEGWSRISDILSIYQDLLFGPPIVSLNASFDALEELNRELGRRGRKLTFFCGHDSTVCTVLSALGAEPYVIEGALEKKTPISVKFVIERRSRNGEQFARLRLICLSWQQLRELIPPSLDNPPLICDLRLKGMEANKDGYYRLEDIRRRFAAAIAAGRNASSGQLPDYMK